MSKFISSSLSIIALAFSLGANAAQFNEGEHYVDLKDKAIDAKHEVVKVYSTNCPFCYKYEKAVIPTLKASLPDGIHYDAYHITTKPPFGKSKATAVAIGKVLGEKKYKDIKMSLYHRYHDEHKKFSSEKEVEDYACKVLGISARDYHAKASTDEVKSLLAKWDQGVGVAKIQGIPAIVVNGKYLIKTSAVRSMAMLNEIIQELSSK